LSFTNPWVFDYPVSFGFDAYKREHSRDSDVGYGYDEKIGGGDIRLGRDLTEYIRGNITYRYDSITIGSVTEDATNDLKKEVGTNKISSIIPEFTFDSRNNVFDTTKGNLFANSLEWAGGPFFGDKKFWKYFARYSHYTPLIRNSVLEFRGRVGIADGYGGDDSIPIYERFFAGGASTIRGYHERKVGPIDAVSKDPLGGNSMLIANMEYTYPVLSFIKVAAFYDVGNVWEKMNKVGTGGFKSGIGFGVRLKTPIGPIMLDYGIPLNKEPGEDKVGSGRFHFSASHGF
jgi:outer membrane protein insertion porin family